MDNQEYTKILTDLFMECATKLYEKERGSGYSQAVENMFRQASGAYNDTLAAKFVHQLKIDYPTIHEKLENYPEIFWQTAQSKNEINDGFKNLIAKETDESFHTLVKGYSYLPQANEEILKLALGNVYKTVTNTLEKLEDAAKKVEFTDESWIPLYTKHYENVISKLIQIQVSFQQPNDISFIDDYIDSKGYKKDLSNYFKNIAHDTATKIYDGVLNERARHRM